MTLSNQMIFALTLGTLLSAALADFHCAGTISSQINSKLIVSGTSCVLAGATVNGPVEVINGGNITIQDGSIVNGNLNTMNAGHIIFQSTSTSIRVDKIDDNNGSGALTICGVIVSGGITSVGRNGKVVIADDGCAETISWGPIKVTGGSDDFVMKNVKNQLSSLTVSDRSGRVDVSFIAPVSSIVITGCTWAQVRYAFVYDKVTITDIGQNTLYGGGGAAIAYSTVQGAIKIQNVLGFVCIPRIKSISSIELKNNTGGIGLYSSKFNHINCENNDFGEVGLLTRNVTVGSATGQCADI